MTGKSHRCDRRIDAEYNGWWSCLIPSEIVNAIGYPLPLFLKWDDVEYGYRAREHGFATVTVPGAGLWHMDFSWKDPDEWSEYFVVRNALVTAALRAEIDPKQTARVLLATIVRLLVSMRYGQAATLIKAAEDFLVGPAILRDGGAAAAAEVRTLRARYPDTVLHRPAEVPGVRPGAAPMIPAGPTPSMPRAVLLKRLVYFAIGKSVHKIGAVSEQDGVWWHVSLFDTALVTDASQDGVRLRRRDRQLVLRLALRAGRMIRRLITDTPMVRREYRAVEAELTASGNWARLFGLR